MCMKQAYNFFSYDVLMKLIFEKLFRIEKFKWPLLKFMYAIKTSKPTKFEFYM